MKSHIGTFSRDHARLLTELRETIEREPYLLQLNLRGKVVTLLNFHAVPTEKGPLREIIALANASVFQGNSPIILAGDFNLPARITDEPLQAVGFAGHVRVKTSLKTRLDVNGGYLRHQYDNVYTRGVVVCDSGVIDFVQEHFAPITDESLARARTVSDHLPVYLNFRF